MAPARIYCSGSRESRRIHKFVSFKLENCRLFETHKIIAGISVVRTPPHAKEANNYFIAVSGRFSAGAMPGGQREKRE